MEFNLRKLNTADVFKMIRIISKCGISEFKKCFILGGIAKEKKNIEEIGINVMLEIVGIVADNLPKCEKEIYSFLAGVSGISEKEIEKLEPAETANMIYEIVHKDEFSDFFTAVSRFFPQTAKTEKSDSLTS